MQVAPLPLVLPRDLSDSASTRVKEAGPGASFGEALNKALQDVNGAQLKADEMIKGFLTGEVGDVHQVTIAMEQGKLMMQLAVEVRNKVVEAYQEISRMQV